MKEDIAFEVMELSGEPTGTHDDMLLLRGEKTASQPGRSSVGLTADYWRFTDVKKKNGEPVLLGYVWYEGDKFMGGCSLSQWEDMEPAERKKYKPSYLQGIDLGDGASVVMRNNQVDLLLTDLFHDFGSRYRSALEAMAELVGRGVLRYRPRTEPTERNRIEALRNRLKRAMWPARYEHDVLIPGMLGEAVWRDLRASGKVKHVTDSVAYMAGYQKYKGLQAAVKCYDIGMREGIEPGQFYKIETALYTPYFKNQGIGVAELTEQPTIAGRIRDRLVKDIGGVLRCISGETMEALQAELDLSPGRADRRHTEAAHALLDRRGTITEQLRELRKEVAENRRRIERLEADRTSQNGF